MLFNSLRFILFFPVVCLVYFLIPKKVRWVWLLASSYFFYICGGAKYALFLVFTTLTTWLSGSLIARTDSIPKKKLILALSFILNIGVLFFCKYFRFGIDILNRLGSLLHFDAIRTDFNSLVPIGISFYTLSALSYTMDVYRGKVEPECDLLRYALFVSFFPSILSGPIQKSRELLPQLQEGKDFDYERVRRGLWLMLWGYFQKMVIGDRLAMFVNGVYSDPTNYAHGGLINLLTIIFYGFQVYLDFDGYSNIAIGAAEVLGFHTSTNFERPFFSNNFSEFWSRWHISLSRWFVDCIYIPLGGNRKGSFRTCLNIFIVFVASGLWHGASWNFVLWGAINGLICITERLLTPAWRRLMKRTGTDSSSVGIRVLQAVYVTLMFGFTQVLFHATSRKMAVTMLRGAFTLNPQILFTGAFYKYGLDRTNFLILLAGLLILLTVSLLRRSGSLRTKIAEQPAFFRIALELCVIFTILLFGIYGPGFYSGDFLYMQF